MKDSNTERLGTSPVRSLFFKMIVPCVLGQMASILNNIIDRMWIGHIDHDAALCLSAVGICMPVSAVLLSLVILVASGMAPNVSIYLGKKDTESAARTTGNSLSTVLMLTVPCVLGVLLFSDDILKLIGCSAASLPYARDYLVTSAWGMLFVNLTMFFNIWLSSLGNVKTGMVIVLISVLLNMVLDPILIFGLDMSVKGAALATNIGAVVAVAYFLYYYLSKEQTIRISLSDMRIRSSIILPVIAIGSSTWMNMNLESFSMFIVNSSLQKFGGDIAVATMSLYFLPVLIFTNLVAGVQMGAQPIVSYNYGKGNRERWEAGCKYFISTSFAISFVIWAILMIMPRAVWSCFTHEAALVDYAVDYGYIYFCLLLVNGVQASQAYILKFLNFVKASIFIGILKKLLLLIPCLIVLPQILPFPKIVSLFMVIPITDLLAFVITMVWYRKSLKTIQ